MEESLGKPELCSPPPWFRDKLLQGLPNQQPFIPDPNGSPFIVSSAFCKAAGSVSHHLLWWRDRCQCHSFKVVSKLSGFVSLAMVLLDVLFSFFQMVSSFHACFGVLVGGILRTWPKYLLFQSGLTGSTFALHWLALHLLYIDWLYICSTLTGSTFALHWLALHLLYIDWLYICSTLTGSTFALHWLALHLLYIDWLYICSTLTGSTFALHWLALHLLFYKLLRLWWIHWIWCLEISSSIWSGKLLVSVWFKKIIFSMFQSNREARA